ncbi:hypothetical protein ACILD6_01075 [Capnocytophaga canimorsus]|uniref:hypothetical protein n=1 Tax=Capnocytophaga canimorsus TaxID=28188 RepID=UPI0037D39EDA
MTALFKQIGDVAMNILGSVGDLIVGVFTLDIDKIKSALGKGFDAIKGAVTQPKAIIGGAINGWNKELSKPIDKEVTISPKTGPKDNDNPINLTPNGTPKGGGGIVPTSTSINNRVQIRIYMPLLPVFWVFFVTLSVTLILKIGFLGWGVPFSWAHANGRSAGPKAVVFGHKKSPKRGGFIRVMVVLTTFVPYNSS